MTKAKLRIGLIGSGFMGKTPAFGYTTAAERAFDLPYEVQALGYPPWSTLQRRGGRERLRPRSASRARRRTGAALAGR